MRNNKTNGKNPPDDYSGLKEAIDRGYRRFWKRRKVDPESAWKLTDRMSAELPEQDDHEE